jgi:Zn-dependent protease with chaperone function
MTFQDPSLSEAARLASGGATAVAAGSRQTASGIRPYNESAVRLGLNRLQAGAANLDQAAAKYNAYVDAHPSAASSTADLAAGPLHIVEALAPWVVATGIYLIIAGQVLNSMFRGRVQSLLSGQQHSFRGGGLAFAYGLHLLLLVALAYLLLVFASFLVVAFGLGAATLILQAPRIPVAVILAIPAVVIAYFWGLIKGVLGIGRQAEFAVDASPEAEPNLWALSRETAAAVGTRPADVLRLSPLSGISVHEEGGLLQLLFGGTRRILTIGAPSVVGLTVQQFRAILGHEYGHLSNKDTAWSSLTFRAGAAVQETLQAMESVAAQGGWFALVALLNPARWVVLGYLYLFAFVTSGFSRMREVFADQSAIETYGPAAFKTGLQTVVVNDVLFASRGLPAMVQLASEGRQFDNVYEALHQVEDNMSSDDLDQLYAAAAGRPASAFDSHPRIQERLQYADRFAQLNASSASDSTPESAEPTLDRFSNWLERSRQLTGLLTGRLLPGLGVHP